MKAPRIKHTDPPHEWARKFLRWRLGVRARGDAAWTDIVAAVVVMRENDERASASAVPPREE